LKTSKIGFKTQKPVKSVKLDQTCIKSGQPVKNIKTSQSLRFLLKWKTMWTALFALPSPLSMSPTLHFPFVLYPFPFSPIQICKNPKITSGQTDQEIRLRSEKSIPLTSSAFDFTCFDSPLTRTFLARRRLEFIRMLLLHENCFQAVLCFIQWWFILSCSVFLHDKEISNWTDKSTYQNTWNFPYLLACT